LTFLEFHEGISGLLPKAPFGLKARERFVTW
jgi:hypothetical protein